MDDQDNCTFKPDLKGLHKHVGKQESVGDNQSARQQFVSTVPEMTGKEPCFPVESANREEASHRYKELCVKTIALDILPSTGLRGKKVDAGLVDQLLLIESQVEYWGLQPAEVFWVISSANDHKVSRLYNLISEKRFVARLEQDKAQASLDDNPYQY